MSTALVFRTIDHNMCDHTWSDTESLATQCRGRVTVVVRKYKRKEWSAKILGLGCERFRVAWSCRSGSIESLVPLIDEAVSRLYPSDANGPFLNY